MRAKTKIKGINLLPREYIQAEQAKRMQMIVGAVVLLETCLFVGVVAIPPKLELNRLQTTLEQKTAETQDERFVDVNKTIEELELAKQEVNDWVEKYGGIKAENFVGAKVLDGLTSRIPMGVVLNTVSIVPAQDGGTEDTISIGCTSTDSVTTMNYITILESMYGRGTVSYSSSLDEETKLYTAEINVTIPKEIEVVEEVPVEGEAAAEGTEEGADSGEVTEGGDNQ